MEEIKFLDIENIKRNVMIIGVGELGSNMINYMNHKNMRDVVFMECDSDKIEIHNKNEESKKIEIRFSSKKVDEQKKQIKTLLEDNTKMVFIVTGVGEESEIAPLITEIAKNELNILTVGIVLFPFDLEGKEKINEAFQEIEKLQKKLDSIFIFTNQKIKEQQPNLNKNEVLSQVNKKILNTIKPIVDIVLDVYDINVDFYDIKRIMKDGDKCIIGTSKAFGEDRAKTATLNAITNNLYQNETLHNAKRALVQVTYGKDVITLEEMAIINNILRQESKNESIEIKCGYLQDTRLDNNLNITVIATDFKV